MGCWNGTCGVSQLPIHCGDKVKLILLKKSVYIEDSVKGGGFCYSNGLFEPYYLPISGEYNDYGTIENIVDQEDKHFNNLSKIIDPDVIFENFEKLIEDISRGEYADLSFVLIHEDLYYKTIALGNKTIYGYGEDKSDIRNFMEPIFKNFLNYDPTRFNSDSVHTRNLPFLIRRNVYSTSFNQPNLKELLDFYIFQNTLEGGRKFWSPQGSAGSQDTDYSLAILLGDYSKEKLKDYNEKYGEEFEDEDY